MKMSNCFCQETTTKENIKMVYRNKSKLTHIPLRGACVICVINVT